MDAPNTVNIFHTVSDRSPISTHVDDYLFTNISGNICTNGFLARVAGGFGEPHDLHYYPTRAFPGLDLCRLHKVYLCRSCTTHDIHVFNNPFSTAVPTRGQDTYLELETRIISGVGKKRVNGRYTIYLLLLSL